MRHPKYLPTGAVQTVLTGLGTTTRRPVMALNPAWRPPNQTVVADLAVAYDRDKRTCQRCRRRVHWFVMPGHAMAPALDGEGRLVHVGCQADG